MCKAASPQGGESRSPTHPQNVQTPVHRSAVPSQKLSPSHEFPKRPLLVVTSRVAVNDGQCVHPAYHAGQSVEGFPLVRPPLQGTHRDMPREPELVEIDKKDKLADGEA